MASSESCSERANRDALVLSDVKKAERQKMISFGCGLYDAP